MGGAVAAVAAAEDGASVLLLEKAAEPGGSTALSGGYVWTVPSLEEYVRLVPHGDAALGRTLVDDFETGMEWLTEHGARLGEPMSGLGPDRAGFGRRLEPDPVSAALEPLLARFGAAGGQLQAASRVVGLVQNQNGVVVGVRAQTGGRVRTVDVGAVILATGGFQGDIELMCRHVSRFADRAVLRASPTSTGDGIRLALAAGAAVSRGLDAVYAHVMPVLRDRMDPGSFRALSQFYVEECILLNLRGERFVDESRSEAACGLALLRQPEAMGMIVFDSARHRGTVMEPFVPDATRTDPLARVRAAGGEVIEAGDLDELTLAMERYGLPPGTSRTTVADFDRAAQRAQPGRLPVPRARGLHRCHSAPFFAVPVVAGVTFTEGGIRADVEGRALDRDLRPVPGLFAAGVDVGGISNVGYVGALSAALVTGLRAGIHAARYAQDRRPEETAVPGPV